MEKIIFIIFLMFSLHVTAEECFNATEIIEKAASPFASAAELEKAVMAAADKTGWLANQESANGAAYHVIGKYGTVVDDNLRVCVTLNTNDDLAYQVFAEKAGNAHAGFMPLKGVKK